MAITQPDPQDFSQFRIGQVGPNREYPKSKIEFGSADDKWNKQIKQGNISNERNAQMQLGGPPADTDPLLSPELFGRDLLERGGSVPIPGRDLMDDLMSVEIGEDGDTTELEEVLRRAWAFREGLAHGPAGESYSFKASEVSTNPDTTSKVKKLQNLFYTVEGSMERPRADYVDIAIEDALDRRVRVAQEFRHDPDKYRAKITRQLTKSYGLRISKEQIKQAVDDQINSLVKDYVAIPRLIELSNHSKVRATFDHAFRQRMAICEDPGKAAKLGSAEMPAPTPDGQHWATLFGGEGDYGTKLNLVFEEMVKVALPSDVVTRLGMNPVDPDLRKQVPDGVYGIGFDNATMFATWLEHMLKKADGRMDVAWGAWKMMLTWEVGDDLGQFINKKGKFTLASPPIGNPLMTYLAHWKEKTTTEFGLNAKGERTQKEKFVAHSGLPLTFGHVPNLCEQYFIEAKVGFDKTYLDKPWMQKLLVNAIKNLPKKINSKGEIDTDYQSECFARQKYFDKLVTDLSDFKNKTQAVDDKGKPQFNTDGSPKLKVEKINISLWDIWLYGRISFADKDFPWFATDQAEIDPGKDELPTSGELPSGSVGMWYLTRGRSWGDRGGVGNDLKSLPMLKDLGSPDFFTSRVRTWAKVLGTVSDELPVEENVRMWWVMGIIAAHQTGRTAKVSLAKGLPPILSKNPELDFTMNGDGEMLLVNSLGDSDARGVTYASVFENARICGFLRDTDIKYIKEQLKITHF